MKSGKWKLETENCSWPWTRWAPSFANSLSDISAGLRPRSPLQSSAPAASGPCRAAEDPLAASAALRLSSACSIEASSMATSVGGAPPPNGNAGSSARCSVPSKKRPSEKQLSEKRSGAPQRAAPGAAARRAAARPRPSAAAVRSPAWAAAAAARTAPPDCPRDFRFQITDYRFRGVELS